jgi:hypothetical protein
LTQMRQPSNKSLETTQHFAAITENMHTLNSKVLGGSSLSR